jgi:hypothetical protein
MALIYEKNKQHIYNWRKNNLDRNRLINKLSMRRKYSWNAISKQFCNILLPDLIIKN